MPTNCHLINDFDIIRPAQLLDKGLPIPGLTGRYVVDEGWCAIISEGGAFREILGPGQHLLSKYSFWRDVKAIAIDMRIQTLNVTTSGEFSIAVPVPVQINLNLSVEYRVSDPRRVAMEIRTPLTSLYDRVIQAVRGVVVNATIEEIRKQGEGIASATLQRMQAMHLPAVLGIEIFNVLVTSIKATDVGEDALAALQKEEYTTVRKWQLDSEITRQSQVTWEWLLLHRPEIAQQMITTHGMLAKEMIDKGLLDPAGFLNQPVGGFGQTPGQISPTNLLGNFSGFPGAAAPPLPGQQPQLSLQPPVAGQLPVSSDIHARMREEVDYLEKLPGTRINTKPGTNSQGIPDGSYDLRIVMPRSSGGHIIMYCICPTGYPQTAPTVEIEIDDQPTPFQSAALRRWGGQYLVEIAREVKQYFG
jgi:hypothetical protein